MVRFQKKGERTVFRGGPRFGSVEASSRSQKREKGNVAEHARARARGFAREELRMAGGEDETKQDHAVIRGTV